tara:strand:- start:2373 stop:2606 length:234 start_codon:yes stop_codon:yes gene_type:complete
MIDAVITDLEMQIETSASIYGHYVSFRFIDVTPSFPKVNDMVQQVKQRNDVILVDWNYSFERIDENTDISYFEITRH